MNPEPPSESTLRFWRKALYVSIGLTVIPPLLGLIGYLFGTFRSFQNLSASAGGADPKTLAAEMALSLIIVVFGLGIGVLGLIFFIVCLVRFFTFRKYKKQPQSL